MQKTKQNKILDVIFESEFWGSNKEEFTLRLPYLLAGSDDLDNIEILLSEDKQLLQLYSDAYSFEFLDVVNLKTIAVIESDFLITFYKNPKVLIKDLKQLLKDEYISYETYIKALKGIFAVFGMDSLKEPYSNKPYKLRFMREYWMRKDYVDIEEIIKNSFWVLHDMDVVDVAIDEHELRQIKEDFQKNKGWFVDAFKELPNGATLKV